MKDNPFLASLGARLVVWERDRAEVECALRPDLLNRSGAVQGGVIATLIDVACGYSGLYSDDPAVERHAVTITMNVNYVSRVEAGLLRAIGTRYGGGRKVFFSRADIVDGQGNLIASGQCAHKYLPSRQTN